MKYEVVILGSDINAYYMGRSYYELYQRKAFLLAKEKMNFTSTSKLFNIEYVGDIWQTDIFLNVLTLFSKKYPDTSFLLIPSNDFYVRLINENAAVLKDLRYIFHENNIDLIDSFLVKDIFYSSYENEEFLIPKTYIYDINTDLDIAKVNDFMYPVILKPGNGVNYYKHSFTNQAKVYILDNEKELVSIVNTIRNAGYSDQLIIQEFIPGDDTKLFDCIMYVGKDHKVKLATFAQIGLQEHTSSGVGNLTVLVNGFSEYDGVIKQVNILKDFIEKSGYTGFLEFDLKYDVRDQQFKVFEINPRQARSSYYLTALGHNLVQYLIDDLILDKPLTYTFLDEKIVLSFVPKQVINEYIKNPILLTKIQELIKQGKYTDPLNCPQDKSIKRSLWLKIRERNYIKKYRLHHWGPKL